MEKGRAWQLVASCFEQRYATFVRYAYTMTGDLAFSEDLVSEVYFRLYLQLQHGNVIERPDGWAFCVLRREIGRRHKRPRSEAQPEPLEAVQSTKASPLIGSGSNQATLDRVDLGELLRVLTPREREVIVLRMEGLKYREIAELLGISSNSVNTLLARAIRKLRKAAKKSNLRFSDVVVQR